MQITLKQLEDLAKKTGTGQRTPSAAEKPTPRDLAMELAPKSYALGERVGKWLRPKE